MAETHITESTFAAELGAGRTITYFTRGVSMRPLLRTAETHVHICPLAGMSEEERARRLPHGIVLYQRTGGQLVLHRLIKQEGDVFWMRGDNTYGLEPIREEQLLGVVDRIWRKGAYIDVLTDRAYRRYVRRRLLTYPLRCAVHFPCLWARKTARRLLRRGKSAPTES